MKRKDFLLIIVFIIICIFVDNIIGYSLDKLPKKDNRDLDGYMWRDLYKSKENSIDMMFVGSSHARFAFDTSLFDKKLGKNTFNLSTPDQTPLAGYYALKQALKYQKPKMIIYEAYWNKMCTDDNTTAANFIYDYMKDEFLKLKLMYSLKEDNKFKDFFLNSYVKSYKHRQKLNNFLNRAINGDVLSCSSTVADINDFGKIKYGGKGYLETDVVVSPNQLNNSSFKRTKNYNFNNKQLEYFQNTIDLCKENNIKMLIVTAPMPLKTLSFVKEYSSYSKKINDIALKNNVKYIDYNIINMSQNLFDDSCFMDSNHMNSKGAQTLDLLLLDVIK